MLLFTMALVLCVLDQTTKHWAQKDLQHRPGRSIVLVPGYLSFSYVRNPGMVWGMLSRYKSAMRRPFFLGVSLVAMGFIIYLFSRLGPGQRLLAVALSSIMGGALGNFIDRLRHDYVVDFIDFHIRQHFKWPTFNVADIAITCGVALLLGEMIFGPYLARMADRRALASAPRTTPGEPAATRGRPEDAPGPPGEDSPGERPGEVNETTDETRGRQEP